MDRKAALPRVDIPVKVVRFSGEALVECRTRHKASVEDIWRYAKICRVANIMKPYLEATG